MSIGTLFGYPNLFCKLTNKFKALMDSTPKFANLLHVQVARMLAFVLWDWQEIFGDCQIFDMYLNNILDLSDLQILGTKCEDEVRKYEQVRELRFASAISFCILHFAFCKLHFSKFAGGKNILFQTHSQSRIAIVICR